MSTSLKNSSRQSTTNINYLLDDETEDEQESIIISRTTSPIKPSLPTINQTTSTSNKPLSLKVKLSLSTSSAQPLHHHYPTRIPPTASTSTLPYQRRRSSSPFTPKGERPLKKLKSTISSHTSSTTSTPSTSASTSISTSTLKKKQKVVNRKNAAMSIDEAAFTGASSHRKKEKAPSSANRKQSRPLPTPARSSLRQVLQTSMREHTVSRDNSPAPDRMKRIISRSSSSSGNGSSSSDLDSEAEDQIEKAEERALREEFERGSTETGDQDYSTSDEDKSLSESSEEDFEEGWEERARERAEDRLRTNHFLLDEAGGTLSSTSWTNANLQSKRDRSVGAFSVDLDAEDIEVDLDISLTDIPPTGGRGVVTWSDYDSVEDSEADEDAGEFEDELEQLLALSEAVVGPVQKFDYEFGEMWFEEVGHHGDDESGSGNEDSDDEGDKTLTLVDGFHRAVGDSSEDSSDESDDDEEDSDGHQYGFDFDEDDGDTTDSLDSDDHVGLVRFGIEVDTDSTAMDSDSDNDFFNLPPGTISLATVQPPTTADLAALPQARYLLSSNIGQENGIEMMIDLHDLERDPSKVISQAAKGLGVNKGTAARILGGVDKAWLQQGYPKLKERVNGSIEESSDATAKPSPAGGRLISSKINASKIGSGGPAMGSFMPKTQAKGKGKAQEINMVIDGSDNVAPSPFSKLKKGKKRARDLFDGTPSRRSRADSKVSTVSAHSMTDRSVSGELPDLDSTRVSPELPDFDLDDVLHASILGADADATSGSSSSDEVFETNRIIKGLRAPSSAAASAEKKTGLSDLSRWSRVPIGAFRNNSTVSMVEEVAGFKGHHHTNSNNAATLFSPAKSHKVRRQERRTSLTSATTGSTSISTTHRISLAKVTSPMGLIMHHPSPLALSIGRGIDHHSRSPLFKSTNMTSSPVPLSLD